MDAKSARKEAQQRGEKVPGLLPGLLPGLVPGLVHNSWELRRAGPYCVADDDPVVVRGVIAYDVASDGSLVYSNGGGDF